MIRLSMRLDIGFTTADLNEAAELVEGWLGLKLEHEDDLELGGHYARFSPQKLPEIGVCGVRVRKNHVEGLGWRLKHRPELPLLAEVELCSRELLELGRHIATLRNTCGDVASLAVYVVNRSPPDGNDPIFPRAHIVRFATNGKPDSMCPDLLCYLTFGLQSTDLETAGAVASDLIGSVPVEKESGDLGGKYLELTGPIHKGLVRPNQLSLVNWLYPCHQQYRLLLNVSWETPNLVELGEFSQHVEARAGAHATLLGYRVAGDLVRDRVPRLHVYETGI